MGGQARFASIDVDDAAFRRGLEKAFAKLRGQDEKGLLRTGLDIVNRAKEMCPVATGRLRASIRCSEVHRDSKGFYVVVGSDVQYAPYVEYGTSRQSAQPYLRPALAEVAGFHLGGGSGE